MATLAAALDLRAHTRHDVLQRVEQVLGVRLDLAGEVRKRRGHRPRHLGPHRDAPCREDGRSGLQRPGGRRVADRDRETRLARQRGLGGAGDRDDVASTFANNSARQGWSLMSRISAYSMDTRRPLVSA